MATENNKKTKGKKTVIKKNKIKKEDLIIPLYNLKGEIEKEISLPTEIFNYKVNERLLAQYVYIYLNNQKKATVSTKTRGEVSGSTKKIYRQKGTGKARHGDIKAPIFAGGGVVGGPKPYKKKLRMNKKQKKQALFASLSLKAKNKEVIGFSSEVLKIEPKTKKAVELIKKINFLDKKTLVVLPKLEKNSFILAFRNLPKIKFAEVASLNPYLILNNEKIIIFESVISFLNQHFLKIKALNN